MVGLLVGTCIGDAVGLGVPLFANEGIPSSMWCVGFRASLHTFSPVVG